jgi:putative transposase
MVEGKQPRGTKEKPQGGEEAPSIRRQCELLDVNRSTLYYEPVPMNAEDLALMREIDELYLKHPFFGSRRITNRLRRKGYAVSRKRVQRLMRLMNLEAVYQKPRTTRRAEDHKVYPYVLRNLTIDRPNQVWATDITYIPMARGFLYLVAIMDWHSRYIVSWKLSNTMESDFCVRALEEALQHGKPEIFNSDQGSQFTSNDFTGVLEQAGVAISMDGKGRCIDNVFVERLWRSLKYEEVYLKAYDSIFEARAGIAQWIRFYNLERPHQALGYRTPQEVFVCTQGDVPEINSITVA